jgi:N-acetylmuramoyl-L-alanine amidase
MDSDRASNFFFALAIKILFVVLFLGATVGACDAHNVKTSTTLKLQESANVLRRISMMSRNGVPDAVLNTLKCLIVIPSVRRNERRIDAVGVATCRKEDSWTQPQPVRFSGSGIGAPRSNLVIFLMTEETVEALRAGELRIAGADSRPAPLVRTDPIPQHERQAAVLRYELAGASLFSSNVIGTLRLNHQTAESNQSAKKTSGTYIATVTSFVNTIIPTGIVLHHTAIIPGQGKPPRSERAIDRYHEERGFEILCAGRLYHVAYHYLIMANGTVRAGRPERCEGAHASGYNSYLGISVVGDFSSRDNPSGTRGPEKPTPAQVASLVRLCRRLRTKYRIPRRNIVRHSDISNTECPGDRFPYEAVLHRLATN